MLKNRQKSDFSFSFSFACSTKINVYTNLFLCYYDEKSHPTKKQKQAKKKETSTGKKR